VCVSCVLWVRLGYDGSCIVLWWVGLYARCGRVLFLRVAGCVRKLLVLCVVWVAGGVLF